MNKHFIAGINDYVERVNHYMPFEVVTIPELKNTKNLTEDQQKQAEGELILKQLQPSDTVVLLDEHGSEYRSIEFARWLEQKRNTARRLVFVIGGPYGFSKDVYARANEQLTDLHGTDLSRVYDNKRRTLPSRITAGLSQSENRHKLFLGNLFQHVQQVVPNHLHGRNVQALVGCVDEAQRRTERHHIEVGIAL